MFKYQDKENFIARIALITTEWVQELSPVGATAFPAEFGVKTNPELPHRKVMLAALWDTAATTNYAKGVLLFTLNRAIVLRQPVILHGSTFNSFSVGQGYVSFTSSVGQPGNASAESHVFNFATNDIFPPARNYNIRCDMISFQIEASSSGSNPNWVLACKSSNEPFAQ